MLRCVTSWTSFTTNTADGWRQTLGMGLRAFADWLDGRESVAVEMLSLPPLSDVERTAILRKALVEASDLFSAEVRQQCEEVVMRDWCPELYSDQGPES